MLKATAGATWPPIEATPAVTDTARPAPIEGTSPETMVGPRSPKLASTRFQFASYWVTSAMSPLFAPMNRIEMTRPSSAIVAYFLPQWEYDTNDAGTADGSRCHCRI